MPVITHKRNLLIIIILLLSNIGVSQQAEKLTIDSLKLELAKFLVEKNQLKNIEEFTVKNREIFFGGIHKRSVENELISGIYVFNNYSNHSFSFFVIVDNNSFSILDISTFNGLKESIHKTLLFSIKQNYCSEIIEDYLSRIINVHYTLNRNPRNLINKNCEFDRNPVKSTFDINSLKIKLAEFLVKEKELKDIDFFFKYPEFLMIEKIDIYYGIKENEKMDCGIYAFGFLNNTSESKIYFLILNEDWIEIFDIGSVENLSEGIIKILDFTENHKYCHLKTGQIIQELIKRKNIVSCLDNPTFKLP